MKRSAKKETRTWQVPKRMYLHLTVENLYYNTLISSLKICMVKNILYFKLCIVTPRNFINAKLSIHKPGSSSGLIKSDFISTDEDPGLRIESFAIIKLRGVTTKFRI